MAYYNLTMVKKNLEVLPGDNSLDDKLTAFGMEADSWVDAYLGNITPLSSPHQIIVQASSNYAAARYLYRVNDAQRGDALVKIAESQLDAYKKGLTRVTVFG